MADLTYGDGEFLWTGGYHTRQAPKDAGFRWDPERKVWWSKDASAAARLRTHADAPAAKAFAEYDGEVEASRAADADLEVPCPEGLAYLPFQRAGVSYSLSRRAVLIGDEPGLGKTIESAGIINVLEDVRRVLVICPASLRINWKRELQKWLVRPLRVAIAMDAVPPPDVADVVILNYDRVWKLRERLRDYEWDIVIADEAHFMKNAKAQRTRAVFGGRKRKDEPVDPPLRTKRWVLLTGTPITNRPIELWPLLKVLDPEGLGASWYRFVTRYCGGRKDGYGGAWDVSGATNLPELQERLRGRCMIRRLKADVLEELPAKRRQVIELPANGATGCIADEQKAWAQQAERLMDLRATLEMAKATDDGTGYRDAVEALRDGARAAFTEISKLRHATALAKVPRVIEHLQDALEAQPKAIAFAHHKDVIKQIMDAFPGEAVRLTGDDSMAARQAAVDRFQSDPGCRLFVGSITAAGVGLTLTAASYVLFAELSWVPGDMSQAEDRCHRVGQRDSVLVQHLVLEGSLDARMARVLVDKQDVIDRALDTGEEPPEINVPVLPDSGGTNATPKRLEIESQRLSALQIDAAHAGLRFLASVCDGASTIDAQGFSGIDVRIGHDLAACERLTARQAALGRRILRKYRKTQLPEPVSAALWPDEETT